MSYTSLSKTQGHNTEMLNGLVFYKEELERMKLRLLEVAGKNSSMEARQGMEHFEAQFTLQRTRMDELRHNVHELSQKMAQQALSHAGKVDERLVEADKEIFEQYRVQEKIIHDLRSEFNRYLAKWM
ncbi:MAG: hypothetical protein ACK4E0_04875 [Chitinophagaceae bacterium]